MLEIITIFTCEKYFILRVIVTFQLYVIVDCLIIRFRSQLRSYELKR